MLLGMIETSSCLGISVRDPSGLSSSRDRASTYACYLPSSRQGNMRVFSFSFYTNMSPVEVIMAIRVTSHTVQVSQPFSLVRMEVH